MNSRTKVCRRNRYSNKRSIVGLQRQRFLRLQRGFLAVLESWALNLWNLVLALEKKTFQFRFGDQKKRYSLLKSVGIVIGGCILAICMQHPASAQVAKGAETTIQSLFNPFMPDGSGDVIQLVFGVGRLMLFGLAFGLIGLGVSEATRGRGGDIWFVVGGALLIAMVLVEASSRIVFGTT